MNVAVIPGPEIFSLRRPIMVTNVIPDNPARQALKIERSIIMRIRIRIIKTNMIFIRNIISTNT